jgi:hypothetical protein
MAFLFLPPHFVPYRHHSLLFTSKSSSLFSPLHHPATSSGPCRCSGHPPAVQPRSLHRRQEDYVVLSSIQSAYDDDMAILKASETSASRYAGSKILVNASGNILSMYNQNCIWTDLYFDEFASLPPIIPEGPIAILGRRNSSSDPSRALAISETRRLGN